MTTFGYSHFVKTEDGAAIKQMAGIVIDHLQLCDEFEETVERRCLANALADLCWLAQTSEFANTVAQIESLLDSALAHYEQCKHCGNIVSLADRHHQFPDSCWDCGDAEMLTANEDAETVKGAPTSQPA